jgi:uncharacterized protein (TIGR02145 family)
MIRNFGFLLLFLMMTGCLLAQEPATVTDQRDGTTYKTVKIGEQVWMAENLNWERDDSYCYEDKPENCKKYGRLYEWDAALRSCPDDWRLPADSDWVKLANFLGGPAGAGVKLNIYGKSGFKGLYSGRRLSYGQFYYLGSVGIFWSSTEVDKDKVFTKTIAPGNTDLVTNNYDKYNAYSVRCIKGKGVPPPPLKKANGTVKDDDGKENNLDDGDNEEKDQLFK